MANPVAKNLHKFNKPATIPNKRHPERNPKHKREAYDEHEQRTKEPSPTER